MEEEIQKLSCDKDVLPSTKHSPKDTVEEMSNYISSDEEVSKDLAINPVKHRLKMTTMQWAITYILALFLVPIRAVLIFATIVLAGIVSNLALYNLNESEKTEKPISPQWRKQAQKAAAFLGRVGIRLCGFSVTVIGEMASVDEAPILVAAPHSTFFDGIVAFWAKTPYLVSREESKKLPMLGKCIELSQSISVKREDPNSRQHTVHEIIRRANLHNHPDPTVRWPHLLIFPEGSTSNRKALMTFKNGAFYPGKPVQPVLIRYPNQMDTVTWTWNQPHGAKSILWTTLAQPFTRAQLEFLPVYHPNASEQKDPKLFASNVRELMAKSLEIPTSSMTFEEVKSRYAKLYKNKRLIKLKDKEE